MWQSELFCFTCCLSRGVVSVCMCVDLRGCARKRERERLKGEDVQERVRSGSIYTACNSTKYLAKN